MFFVAAVDGYERSYEEQGSRPSACLSVLSSLCARFSSVYILLVCIYDVVLMGGEEINTTDDRHERQ